MSIIIDKLKMVLPILDKGLSTVVNILVFAVKRKKGLLSLTPSLETMADSQRKCGENKTTVLK